MSAFRIYETDTCVPRGPGPGPGSGPDPVFDWSPPDAEEFTGGIVRLSSDGKLAAVAYTANDSVYVQSYVYNETQDSWSKRGAFLDALSEFEAKISGIPDVIDIVNNAGRVEFMTFDMDDGGDKIVLGIPKLKYNVLGSPTITPEVGAVLAFEFGTSTSTWGGIEAVFDINSANIGRAVSISGDGSTVAFSINDQVKLYEFDVWDEKGTIQPVLSLPTTVFIKLLTNYNGSVVLGLVPGLTNSVYRSFYSNSVGWSEFVNIVTIPTSPGDYIDITANSSCNVLGAFRSGVGVPQPVATCWIRDDPTGVYLPQGNPITANLTETSNVSLNGDGNRFAIGTASGTDVYELSVIYNALSEVLNGSPVSLVEWNKLGTTLGPGNASVDISSDGDSLAVWKTGSDVSTYKYVEQ